MDEFSLLKVFVFLKHPVCAHREDLGQLIDFLIELINI